MDEGGVKIDKTKVQRKFTQVSLSVCLLVLKINC